MGEAECQTTVRHFYLEEEAGEVHFAFAFFVAAAAVVVFVLVVVVVAVVEVAAVAPVASFVVVAVREFVDCVGG